MLELGQQVEGIFRAAEFVLEGGLDEIGGLGFDGLDGASELAVSYLPILVMLGVKDIIREVDQLADLLVDSSADGIDSVGRACYLFEFLTQNGFEFLQDFACLSDVLDDVDHVVGL
jgi:hypothetical protein